MLSRIILGLIVAAAGTAIVIYTESILSFFGSMDWADKWFGVYGGSRLGYKFIGILFIAIGFMIVTNLFGTVLLALFGGLFRGVATTP